MKLQRHLYTINFMISLLKTAVEFAFHLAWETHANRERRILQAQRQQQVLHQVQRHRGKKETENSWQKKETPSRWSSLASLWQSDLVTQKGASNLSVGCVSHLASAEVQRTRRGRIYLAFHLSDGWPALCPQICMACSNPLQHPSTVYRYMLIISYQFDCNAPIDSTYIYIDIYIIYRHNINYIKFIATAWQSSKWDPMY